MDLGDPLISMIPPDPSMLEDGGGGSGAEMEQARYRRLKALVNKAMSGRAGGTALPSTCNTAGPALCFYI